MTDIQIQNQNNNLATNKKEFDHRFDDKPLRILCVKNIPKETTENELLELFKPFGSIENINLKVNKNVGPYAIYAHVYFSTPEEAKRCLKQMNGKILKGRALRIDYKKNNTKLGEGEEDNNNNNNYNNMPNNPNNNNKFHKKPNRTNQFYNNQLYNNRYPNNKRPMRNGFTTGDGSTSQHDPDTNYSREYEPNKRMRMGNFNDNLNINNINSDTDLNKLLREYENRKDSNNNEVENILQTLINDMAHKTPRVKLFLCDHLRKCVQHVFNRPCINISNNNNNLNDISSIPFSGPNHEHRNNPISNLQNYQNINEFEKKRMYNNNSNTILWRGTLEMKNKDNLTINAYGLSGDVNNFLNNNIKNITISHRKKMNNIPKIEAIYSFEIQSEKDINIFESYKNYFNNKDRVGLASANENWHFYIIFPGTPIFNEILNANNNIQTNFNNTFIGVVSYNPQILERNNPRKLSPSQADTTMNNMSSTNDNYMNSNNLQNNFNTAEENKKGDSETNANDQTENDDSKNEVPNWLNQFSSLAAYLVKK
ncbi:RNA-binding protein, putative [Plasmodium chabaudi adami]|uniref:RNA-binding protein, putative n=1 Tax=Plasmodium chabaudi adami TaxID=5826 RepID=A0A1C6XTU8_PLACE|nr:RNA-binding protein, putative [Plasmodium chabaudi adami]